MEFSSNLKTKRTKNPVSSIPRHPFSDVLSQNSVYSVFYHPSHLLLSFKTIYRDTSFHISSYFFPECLLSFLWLVYSNMCGEKFSIYGVHIPRKCKEYTHFYSCLSPPFKTPDRIFWKSVSPKTKRVEEAMTFSIKI